MHLGATPFSIYNTYTRRADRVPARDAGRPRRRSPSRRYPDTILAGRGRRRRASSTWSSSTASRRTGTISLDELAAGGEPDFDFEAAWQAVEPDDVLTLIYTSGTTGPPKGVQITHANICETGPLLRRDDPVPGRRPDRLLPADGARRGAQRAATTCRCCCGFTDHLLPGRRARSWPTCRRCARPGSSPCRASGRSSRPALEQMLAAAPDEQKQRARRRRSRSALEKVRLEQAGEEVPDELAARVAEGRRGGASRSSASTSASTSSRPATSGAAPTPPEVIEFFHALGIPLAELWGMSETTGAGTLQPAGADQDRHRRPARAGRRDQARRGRRGPDQGPVVMKGYRNLPEKTARPSPTTASC